jgi:branched-chain amino acid transport system permease protein
VTPLHNDIQLLMSGLGSGAAYALLALGLVLIFRGSGVLNLAHGAIASVAAYVFLFLAGERHWASTPAVLVAVLVATMLGIAFQATIMRRLTAAPILAKVVATLGFEVALVATIPLLFTDKSRKPISLFPRRVYTLPFGRPRYIIPADRFWLAVIASVVTLLLWCLYRFTNFGRATRATATNERAVSTLGYSPQLLAAINWGLGSALAGLAGVLLAGLVQQSETSLTLILMAAIAASLLAGFKSFGITLAAAMGLSGVQSLLIRYSGNLTSATTIVGWGDLVPFAVILGFMVIRGAPIPLRGALIETRLPVVPVISRPLRSAAVMLVVGVVAYRLLDVGWANSLTVTLTWAMICLSLVVLVGFVGQISLAQVAIAGIGAFFASKAATDWGLPYPIPIVVGGLLAVPGGLLTALPALRVRGINLAVVTMSAAFALDASFFTDTRLTAGAKFPRASLFGIHLSGIRDPKSYGIATLFIFVLMCLGVVFLRQSRIGVRFLGVRANERGAAAVGVSLTQTKLIGFGVAAFIAGTAGGVMGYQAETLSYESFAAFQSLVVVAFAYLGGIGAVVGAFIAGSNFSGGLWAHLFHAQGTAARVLQLVGGVGVMLTIVIHPDGVALLPHDFRRQLAKRRARRSGQATPIGAPSGRNGGLDGAAEVAMAVPGAGGD